MNPVSLLPHLVHVRTDVLYLLRQNEGIVKFIPSFLKCSNQFISKN